jgi:hypothetical protein
MGGEAIMPMPRRMPVRVVRSNAGVRDCPCAPSALTSPLWPLGALCAPSVQQLDRLFHRPRQYKTPTLLVDGPERRGIVTPIVVDWSGHLPNIIAVISGGQRLDHSTIDPDSPISWELVDIARALAAELRARGEPFCTRSHEVYVEENGLYCKNCPWESTVAALLPRGGPVWPKRG